MTGDEMDTRVEGLRFVDLDGCEVPASEWRGECVLLVFMRWLG
jgi:hypothetical protein